MDLFASGRVPGSSSWASMANSRAPIEHVRRYSGRPGVSDLVDVGTYGQASAELKQEGQLRLRGLVKTTKKRAGLEAHPLAGKNSGITSVSDTQARQVKSGKPCSW